MAMQCVRRAASTAAVRMLVAGALGVTATRGAETGPTGGGAPIDNMQPTLALNYLVRTTGDRDHLGEIVPFAGNIDPLGWMRADGRQLLRADYSELAETIGGAYGGDETTFRLPDLRGRVAMGFGQGPGLTQRPLGVAVGTEITTLSLEQLPAHTHATQDAPPLSVTGGSQAISTMQPSLAVSYAISREGNFPFDDGPPASEPYVGQIRSFAGVSPPVDHLPADGSTLSISSAINLHATLQFGFGGNMSSFRLPDLRGRLAVSVGQAGSVAVNRGQYYGAETYGLATNNLPVHVHTLPIPGGQIGLTGGSQEVFAPQPTLGLTYMINVSGAFPSTTVDAGNASFLGEIGLIGGNTIPSGWLRASGQLLPITEHGALFALLGTTYGGNGTTTFALPKLDGRAVLGAGAGSGLTEWQLGDTAGADEVTLTIAQMPAHTHELGSTDFDQDADVDGADFLAWQRGHGLAANATRGQGDADFNGAVNASDYALWRAQLATPQAEPAATGVPEPTALALVVASLVVAASRRRRSRRRGSC